MAEDMQPGRPIRRGFAPEGNGGRANEAFMQQQLLGADHDVFVEVLVDATGALDRAGIPYAVIGGIASSGFGRPRWTHDIDLFVRPDDAARALEALEGAGFRTERTDITWLFKGFKQQVMVDVIFKSKGDFYFDDEMVQRAVQGEFQGRRIRFIPPEDLLVLKAVVHDEAGPHHWHDALGVIAGTHLDWNYLLRRAQRAPRRVLSLLTYAHSVDLPVPNRVIRALFDQVYNS
jgi:predicted nucleotidyltransferase